MGARATELGSWLVRAFVEGGSPAELLAALVEKLGDFELDRVNWIQPTLHPLIRANTYIWRRSDGRVETVQHSYEAMAEQEFVVSPLARLFEDGQPIRRRLCEPETPRDFPILEEMESRGATDYYAFAVTAGITPLATTWATVRDGGFTGEQIEVIDSLGPAIATLLDAHRTRHAAESMLEVYVGRYAAQRIIKGDIRRGVGTTTRAVVWFSDLRGYSALSAERPAEELIGLLNVYFEQMARAVHEHGGEVLKFLGDGMLAVFQGSDDRCQAECALAAASTAIERVGDDGPTVGITLHVGEVVYGNIGAPDRLDFTVIGPAVNQVSRMQGWCARERHSIVVSGELAALAPRGADSIGRVELRGIGDRELFEVALSAASTYPRAG